MFTLPRLRLLLINSLEIQLCKELSSFWNTFRHNLCLNKKMATTLTSKQIKQIIKTRSLDLSFFALSVRGGLAQESFSIFNNVIFSGNLSDF